MGDITQIDRNFAVDSTLEKDHIRFYNADEAPFSIHGMYKKDGHYRRIPEQLAEQVSENVVFLHKKTAGGRIRFRTDSPYVAIRARLTRVTRLPSMPLTSTSGFDLYADGAFVKAFVPPLDLEDGYESVIDFEGHAEREITIHCPIFCGATDLYIGLDEHACVKAAQPYKPGAPIVCYGSSITQGGNASRPGMIYENILARRLNRDFWCLGFSGSAKAEDVMIEYIKGLAMSVFIYDYDHNAPSVEHLRKTHEKMFRAIRQAQPDLPVLILPRPRYTLTEEEKERFAIIEATYRNALAAGDKNVYLIDGPSLMALCGDDGSVDGTHPNDFGFVSMADAIEPVLRQILES